MQTPSRRARTSRNGPEDVRDSETFMNLAHQARERDDLDRRFRQALPSPLGEQVRLASARHGQLVLLAPSSAWASRLRLSQTLLLAKARDLGIAARSIVVKVALPEAPKTPEPHGKLPLSPATARHLRTAAKSLSDPELRDLFLAMASIADTAER